MKATTKVKHLPRAVVKKKNKGAMRAVAERIRSGPLVDHPRMDADRAREIAREEIAKISQRATSPLAAPKVELGTRFFGHTFADTSANGVHLYINHTVTDVNPPNEKVQVGLGRYVEIGDDFRKRLLDAIVDGIRSLWMHEFEETLLYDGVCLLDPHKVNPR